MVCHNYPPAHTAGTETYTAELVRRLAARGHELRVFTAEKDIARPDLSVREREHQGVPVTELTNNLLHDDFRQTWDHPGVAARFGELLDRERPDLVHFQHLLYLSIGCVEEAARRGLPVVYTLHDFWLQCPRFGQRVHADGGLCEWIDFGRCGSCMASFKFAQSPLERRTARAIAGLKGLTGIDLSGAARGAARVLAGSAGSGKAGSGKPGSGKSGSGQSGPAEAGGAESGAEPWPEPAPELCAERERDVRERDRAIRERLLGKVQRFLSPSRFLRQQFIDFGVPPERIEHLPTGIDTQAFVRRPRQAGAVPRVGFVGSLVPLKGPGLLLEAWSRLPESARSKARLELHGPGHHHPAFQAELARRAEALGADLSGPVARAEVPALLAALDLLVVPSLWYENAPLIILEARAVGTPVLVSDVGGMAELVADGIDGRHFRFGDADDLARVLGELLADPARLERLSGGGPAVPDSELNADRMEALYRELLEEPGG